MSQSLDDDIYVGTMKKFYFIIFIFLLTIHLNYCFEDVVHKIKSSFHYAGKLLGLDEAYSVTKLVTEAFGKATKKTEDNQRGTIFSGFFRILGLDTKKISAIAVNAIIFVAQLVRIFQNHQFSCCF